MLAFDEVSYRYSTTGRDVLTSVDLRVDKGQMVALMGPSGSGKSTLLSIAGGLLRPTGGRFRTASGDMRPEARSSSWIFQANWMVPRRSARDNVALAALYQGISWKHACRLADEHLDDLGLYDRSRALVEELSGGEIQRTAVARAFLQPADAILADEPTAQLDSGNAASVMAALLQLARSGRAVLVATHDNFVAGSCDRVVRLRDGMIVDGDSV